MMPERIQLSRAKGWRMPPNTVKVDRTTKWGNPYRVEQAQDGIWEVMTPDGRRVGRYDTRDEATWMACTRFEYETNTTWGRSLIQRELAGKNLACWCPVGSPCHADVLLEIANGGDAS